ncbi:GTPase [Duganella sp. LX20W]|uniref:GTPase n=1 Tax=Rugamonas brunnea TaxID=2758569 RepID=A0A7W2EPF1_9BURK|nr:GTPase [Rugamonas brunnea]MBA5636212.1 GTPase [Rugamonas brunnea]
MTAQGQAGGPAPRAPVATWLVTGATPGAREAAIAAHLQPGLATTVILEGLSDGNSALADLANPANPAPGQPAPPALQLLRIAPGCLHCSGNLVLRVTLNRVLRHAPARLYISMATASHLDQLRDWLSEAPYGSLLALQADIAA